MSKEELETELDKWLYVFKNLTELTEQPEELQGPDFDQFFELARYANLTPEERAMYNDSLKRKWDTTNALNCARNEGHEAGLEQGEHNKAIQIAQEMLLENEPIEKISRYTKLSIEEIQKL